MDLRDSIKRNLPELQALLTGGMPSFVYGVNNFKDIPVFTMHAAKKERIEEQFRHLKIHGYITLNGDELLDRLCDTNYRNNGKEIVLTFDDGLASVWTVGFPLLEKFELKIIAFVLPDLIEEGDKVGLNIQDQLTEEEHSYVINRDCSSSPLCNWKELIKMHESGLVDIQSHGMQHSLISVSSKIVDFIHPKFDTNNYGNVHVPLYLDENKMPTRKPVLGHPVYMSESRLRGKAAFWDDSELRAACVQFVQNSGGEQFFTNNRWKKRLLSFYNISKKKAESSGVLESKKETESAMIYEFKTSKLLIEKKLNKQVKHFCFPWHQANDISVDMAYESGYEAVHLGISNGFSRSKNKIKPYFVNRLVEDYLDGLPGMGKNLFGVFKSKIQAGKSRRRI